MRRFAPVGADDHLLVFKHQAQQWQRQDVGDIGDAQHLLGLHHFGPHPVEHQLNRLHLTGVEQADHPVGIAHGRDFRRGDHDGFIGCRRGIFKAVFDAGGRIDQHHIEVGLDQPHNLSACPRA